VLADSEENAAKSFRNLKGVTVAHVDSVGVADLLGAARLVVSEPALVTLKGRAAE
jgi:large subunit ribosomal protein L4